jgi:hypothetical protein
MIEILILFYNAAIFITLMYISTILSDIHKTLKGEDDEKTDDS